MMLRLLASGVKPPMPSIEDQNVNSKFPSGGSGA